MIDENSDIEISLIGESQGGLIAWKIFEECKSPKNKPISDYIKKLITLGTPNLGIHSSPFSTHLSYEDFMSYKFFYAGPILTNIGISYIGG